MKYRHPPEGRSTKLRPLINMQQKVVSLLGEVGKCCFANCLRERCSAPGRREQGAAPIATALIPGLLGEPRMVISPKVLHPGSCPGKDEPHAESLRHQDSLILVLGATGQVCFCMKQIFFCFFWPLPARRSRSAFSGLPSTDASSGSPSTSVVFQHLKHSKAEVITRIGDAVTLPCQQVIDLLKTLQYIHG